MKIVFFVLLVKLLVLGPTIQPLETGTKHKYIKMAEMCFAYAHRATVALYTALQSR